MAKERLSDAGRGRKLKMQDDGERKGGEDTKGRGTVSEGGMIQKGI